MKLKPRHLLLPLAALAAVPAQAGSQTFLCGMSHYVRAGGTEIASTTITVRNADGTYPATIQRLTVRDGDGNLVHDSGPATGDPLPLNTDFPIAFAQGKDITQVPPGGAVYLRSNHIWGNGGLPGGAAGNEVGQLMSAWVVVDKEGPKSAVTVGVTPRIRTRATSPSGAPIETATLASGNVECKAMPER